MVVAAETPVFDWDRAEIANFGVAPVLLHHSLHTHNLFSDDALVRLIEKTGRRNYEVWTTDHASGNPKSKREGEISDLSGQGVLEAIKRGYLWLHLKRANEVDSAYGDLLNAAYGEMERAVPGFRADRRQMAVLISSPNVTVGYHCDIPGQTLWQIRGQKRIYIYPAKPPFVEKAAIEGAVLRLSETFMLYDPSFDAHAAIFDLQPGQMLHWPLNAPHRVVNADCLNVSFATEHFTHSDRRNFYVNYGNGVLRRHFGVRNPSGKISGATYWAKLGVAAAYKYSGVQRKRRKMLSVDFVVDPNAPGGARTVSPHELVR